MCLVCLNYLRCACIACFFFFLSLTYFLKSVHRNHAVCSVFLEQIFKDHFNYPITQFYLSYSCEKSANVQRMLYLDTAKYPLRLSIQKTFGLKLSLGIFLFNNLLSKLKSSGGGRGGQDHLEKLEKEETWNRRELGGM